MYIYIYLYIIYIYIYLYISIYIFIYTVYRKKNGMFFSVHCKRAERSLRSFPLFAKERKRTERSFFRMEKNITYRTEKNGVPNPAST